MPSLRLALRRLLRTPLFTLTAVATVAIGIAANAAIFTVIDAVILRPLPYPQPEQLVWLSFTAPGLGYEEMPFSPAAFAYVRDGQRTLQDMALVAGAAFNVGGRAEPVRVAGERVTPSFFSVLGARPVLGRAFTAADGEPGSPAVVIVSHAFWQTALEGDSAIIGRELLVDGIPRRVVGVAPASLSFPSGDDRLWVPLVVDRSVQHAGDFSYPCIGRLRPGVPPAAARADIARLIPHIGEAVPDLTPDVVASARFAPVVRDLADVVVGSLRRPLWIAWAAGALVLLITCANVAALFLVRAEGRSRELAVRAALGATRAHLAASLSSECLIVAVAGGLAGLALGAAAVHGVLALLPAELPRANEVGVNVDVVLFTLALSVVSALLFAIAPLRRHASPQLATSLNAEGRSATPGRAGGRLRSALVVGQVAVAVVLLVGAGLMTRTFRAVSHVDPGFRADHVLTFDVTLTPVDYQNQARVAAFWRTLRERLRELPGVERVALANELPLGRGIMNGTIYIEDHPAAPGAMMPVAERQYVSPAYFETLKIPVVRGRTLDARDGAAGVRAVVVNQSFARHWWPHGDPIGRLVRQAANEPWYQIVGVVGDVRFTSLDREGGDAVYFPISVGPPDAPRAPLHMSVALRTAGDPLALAPAARGVVRALDAHLPVANVRSLQALVTASLARVSFVLFMLGVAAAVALLLGVLGIYGIVSYTVAHRRREIGVRMALGATAATVRGMVVRRGVALASCGAAVGLAASLAFTRLLRTLLYGVDAGDPLTYVLVTAMLLAVTALASYLPAVRASATDPAEALRPD